MAASAQLLLDALTPDPPEAEPVSGPVAGPVAGPVSEPVEPPLFAGLSDPDVPLTGSGSAGFSEPPLTSEPPLAAPLTSESPIAAELPLTSEPTAAGLGAEPADV
ncbi:hypothetical protein [Streptomyces sp. NPDC003077]|uniref:hypothetical protein n=1 Tax=Streptomyces sp. NPDC003077 TaxID=3154443 RepID=UPI0033ACCB87